MMYNIHKKCQVKILMEAIRILGVRPDETCCMAISSAFYKYRGVRLDIHPSNIIPSFNLEDARNGFGARPNATYNTPWWGKSESDLRIKFLKECIRKLNIK